MEKYSNYFPFNYKEYEIPVAQCYLAPDHYNSRQIDAHRVNECVLFFAASANRPGACAYLMPVKNAGKKKGIPMKQSEVSEEKLRNSLNTHIGLLMASILSMLQNF